MATTILPGTVVPEALLGKENYDNWSACIKNYLLAQDLWDIIETSMEPPKPGDEVEFKAWRKKNAATLHAIQMSCGMNILSEIKGISSAKFVWDTLAETYEQPEQAGVNLRLPESGSSRTTEFTHYAKLYEAVQNGNMDRASHFITQHPDSVRAKITQLGQTALHVAVLARQVDMVRWLVEEKMLKEDLEIRDNEGLTALAQTIIIRGYDRQIVGCMINKNRELVTIRNNRGLDIPVVLALRHEQTELANYLFEVTPLEELLPERGPHGATVLTKAIHTRNFELAAKLISSCPVLAFTLDTDNISPLYVLHVSMITAQFGSSASERNWSTRLRQMVYSCIKLMMISPPSDLKYYLDNRNKGQGTIGSGSQHSTHDDHKIGSFQQMEIMKIVNDALKSSMESGVTQALIFSAVKAGDVKLVDLLFEHIGEEKRELLYRFRDGKRRNILMSAVQHREAEIFGRICSLEEATATLLPTRDNHGNNILHVAGTLTELISPLEDITGAALKMQTEVQWFKEVESLCNPTFSNERNYAGLTPQQVFMHTHKELIKQGEQWMKDTASSCTVIGALIMTIMFAATFTIPGVLTSRTYAAKDFLHSLPKKMIIGLSTLLLSIETMMIAFICAILIMLGEELWIVLPLVGLAIVPVSLYVFMLYGVLRDMYVSTYGSGTISRKMRRGLLEAGSGVSWVE